MIFLQFEIFEGITKKNKKLLMYIMLHPVKPGDLKKLLKKYITI